MDTTHLLLPSRHMIQAYGEHGLTLGGETHAGSVIVTPERIIPSPLQQFSEMEAAHLLPFFAEEPVPEIVLIGSGRTQQFLPPVLRRIFRERGIGVDCMDTGAACRTFNVLLAEERRVAALLLALTL